MLVMKKLLISVAALLNLMPGFLVLQKSEFIPPYDGKTVFVILSTFVGTVCFLLVYFNKDKINGLSSRKINLITILSAAGFIIFLTVYSLLISDKVKRDGFGATILPIVKTRPIVDLEAKYGNLDNYLHADGDTGRLQKHIADDPESVKYVSYTVIIFIFLYTILNALLVLSISIIGVRLRS
jgi:hypothetical protein